MDACKCSKNINRMPGELMIVVSSPEREGTKKVNKEDFNLMCISFYFMQKYV